MNLISLIIAKEWLKSLFGALVVLFILLTVGDIVNGFLRNWEASRVFLEYILKMPDLMGKMIPISSLLATLFCLNKLKSKSELIAILAGGYSIKKFYFLILILSSFVALLQFINLGFLDPYANKIKRQQFEKSRMNESKYLARSTVGGEGYLWYKTSSYFASFLAFDSKNNSLKNLSLYFYNNDHLGTKIVTTKSANFIDGTLWKINQGTTLDEIDANSFPVFNDPKNFTIDLGIDPSSFGQFESDITTLNIVSLYKFIQKLAATEINTSEYEVMLFEKLSLSLICIIFGLFPMSGIFNANQRSSSFGKSVVFTLIFSVLFWMSYSSIIAFGNSGKLSPAVATGLIPGVFIIYITLIYFRNRKL